MSAPQRCDACGGVAVKRGDHWEHANPEQAALSPVGPHDPFKADQGTVDYLAAVMRGDDR